jgi:Ca2+-transporting ATPase
VIITQFGGRVFSTVPLSLRDWILIVVGTSVVLWIGEIWRAMRRARR